MQNHSSFPLLSVLALTLAGCSGGPTKGETGGADTDTVQLTDNDGDGFFSDEDCDDYDSQTFPGAQEVCDTFDNDCDAEIDEGVTLTWYEDADDDGFGDDANPIEACSAPEGAVSVGNDCDDANDAAHPGGLEVCDEADNDCDGGTDEDVSSTWYTDSDGDSYGDPASATEACDQPTGTVADGTDCDDTVSSTHPDADESCDTIDNDCDGETDEAGAIDPLTWYEDRDEDGFGDLSSIGEGCTAPDGYVADSTDCDDLAPETWPGAPEICDGVDTNCDGSLDEGASDAPSWYADTDTDGYGDPAVYTTICDAPAGTVADNTDCDDTLDSVHPGAAELCDSIDDDCDGEIDEDSAADAATWYGDADGDSFGDAADTVAACSEPENYTSDNTDCDDGDPAINPDASELCDGADNDCNGEIDDGEALDGETWYADTDDDGWGDPDNTMIACDVPSGYTANRTDCDDHNSTVHPFATETCNETDDDCDGLTDEGRPADSETYYADADGDGYGDASDTDTACDAPTGYVSDDTDCDDTDADINPGETEYCDGTDDNCDETEDGTVTFTNSSSVRSDLSATWAAGTSSSPAALTISSAGTYAICPGLYYVSATIAASGITLDGPYGSGETILSGGSSKRTLYTTKALTITGLTLTDGDADTGNGGNLYTSSTLTASDLILDGGTAAKGGNLYCNACTLSLDDVQMNNGDADSGGGLYATGGTITATELLMDSNVAANGANFFGTKTTGTLTSSALTGGTASSYGGGIYLTTSSDISLSDSEISGNTAIYGGGASVTSSTLSTSDGSNITDNTASLVGGGVYLGATGVLDCTGSSGTTAGIWGNTAPVGGGAYTLVTTSEITSTTCDWTGSSDNATYDIMLTFYYYNYGNNASFYCTGYSCS